MRRRRGPWPSCRRTRCSTCSGATRSTRATRQRSSASRWAGATPSGDGLLLPPSPGELRAQGVGAAAARVLQGSAVGAGRERAGASLLHPERSKKGKTANQPSKSPPPCSSSPFPSFVFSRGTREAFADALAEAAAGPARPLLPPARVGIGTGAAATGGGGGAAGCGGGGFPSGGGLSLLLRPGAGRVRRARRRLEALPHHGDIRPGRGRVGPRGRRRRRRCLSLPRR